MPKLVAQTRQSASLCFPEQFGARDIAYNFVVETPKLGGCFQANYWAEWRIFRHPSGMLGIWAPMTLLSLDLRFLCHYFRELLLLKNLDVCSVWKSKLINGFAAGAVVPTVSNSLFPLELSSLSACHVIRPLQSFSRTRYISSAASACIVVDPGLPYSFISFRVEYSAIIVRGFDCDFSLYQIHACFSTALLMYTFLTRLLFCIQFGLLIVVGLLSGTGCFLVIIESSSIMVWPYSTCNSDLAINGTVMHEVGEWE